MSFKAYNLKKENKSSTYPSEIFLNLLCFLITKLKKENKLSIPPSEIFILFLNIVVKKFIDFKRILHTPMKDLYYFFKLKMNQNPQVTIIL